MLKHAQSRKAIQNLLLLSPAILLLTIGTGCGMSYNPVKTAAAGSSTFTVSDTSSGGVPTSIPATSAGSGTQTPYHIKFQGTGYTSYSVSVSTGTTLKVRFIPGKQNTQNNGQFYQYSALGVYVGIGTNIQPTELINNGYGGGQAQQSSVIDLSDFVPAKCSSGDPTCRQSVTISVSQPNDDDGCINLGYQYCPYSHVPDGHSWNGTLVVQTDDTTAI